jgi:hypothetical protein
MKRLFVKIGKTGKRVTAILGLITAVFACIGICKSLMTKNISGKWNLKFVVQKCNHKEYIGDEHTQMTVFTQSNENVSGKGEKWTYRGEMLPFSQHRKIEYNGTVEGKEFRAIYVLHGLERDSEGSIVVTIGNDGKTMEGTFSGTIGNDSGIITGEKID